MESISPQPKIIVVCGPTAVGKTSAGIMLARRFNGEIISADSRQVYRHLNIGAAKPSPAEQVLARHHLIDAVDPGEHFDARRFAALARKAASEIIAKNKIPIVVGGTGLYIKAMLHGLFADLPSVPEVRAGLKQEAEKYGGAVMHERLEKVDPETAGRLHPKDVYRIVRALEVYEITGKSISHWRNEHRFREKHYNAFKIGLFMEREILYARIDQRVDMMISEGLLEEVRELLEQGFSPELKSMKAIGYAQMVDFLEKRLSWEDAVELLKRDTRRYAKRQLTWFKGETDISWVEPSEIEKLFPAVENFLKEKT